MLGVKPALSQLKDNGSPACAVLPQQETRSKLDSEVEKGHSMGVGMAGMRFLSDGGTCIMEPRDRTVVETQMPISGDLAVPVHAEPQQPSFPHRP